MCFKLLLSIHRRKSYVASLPFQITFLIVFVFVLIHNANAQVKDSVTTAQEKIYKNTLKVNVTSWILYSDGIQLNYERILSKKRSISFYGGIIHFPMPSLISNSSMTFNSDKKKSGFSIGSEYRFYLSKENKYDAPMVFIWLLL